MAKQKSGEKSIAVNRRARFDYHIEETYEAGIVLTGGEVKSLREGRANLKDSYGRIDKGEAFLLNAHISNYEPAHYFNLEPTRTRKLLLHKKEIMRLMGKVQEQGLTLIPLRLYFKNGHAKVELALARGKKLYDKRETTREREVKRDIARAMSRNLR
ncbi:MAG TPA: SsrA-binding protein SmpB [Methylomirabilota bacterium]|jgi:SsrA-binding protein|nr:SsrA-binding protein SmpB [Methylomirabilota bacterium]